MMEHNPKPAPTPLPAAAATADPDDRLAGEYDPFYPCSDGKPMAENMWQGKAIMAAAEELMEALPQTLVAANILMYPECGNNRNSIAPDVLAASGVGTHNRWSYFVWREGKPPDWVLDVAAPSMGTQDRNEKLCRYAQIGVPECWLFDPRGDVFARGMPRLQAYRLAAGKYRAMASRQVAGERVIRSCALGLDVCTDGELLRFRDTETGTPVLHRAELTAQIERDVARCRAAEVQIERDVALRRAAETRAQQDAAQRREDVAARLAAEARIAELEAALRRLPVGR